MLRDLQKLEYIASWRAETEHVSPAVIPEGMEKVELLTGGTVLFPVNGELKAFSRGTMFWHVAGEKTVHLTKAESLYSCLVFSFRVTSPRRPGPRISIWNPPEEGVAFGEKNLRIFHAGVRNAACFQEYVYSTLAWHSLHDSPDLLNLKPEVLIFAMNYLQENLKSCSGLETAAEACQISLPYLFALFRKHLGMGPHRYLLKQRIARAKILLAEGDLPIKEIVSECGFETPGVFFRHFREESGCTPAEYRRRIRPE